MHPLETPKPLLKVGGKPLIEHLFTQLDGLVDEVIVVAGQQKAPLEALLKGRATVVEQSSPQGTFHALLQARSILKDRFLVLAGDDLYQRKDLEALIAHPRAILAQEVEKPERFGVVEMNGTTLTGILEKPV